MLNNTDSLVRANAVFIAIESITYPQAPPYVLNICVKYSVTPVRKCYKVLIFRYEFGLLVGKSTKGSV